MAGVHSFAVLALVALAWAQSPCDTPDVVRSRCNCNGVTYDFSQMKDAVSGSTLFQGVHGDYNFFFEMVNNGLPSSFTGCTFDPSLAVGNAGAEATMDGSTCYPIGSVSQQTWTITSATESNAQVINVIFSGGQEGRQTSLEVTCDPTTTGTFYARGETSPGSLIYEVDINSCAACPNGCGAPPPTPPPPPPPPTPPPSAPTCTARTSSQSGEATWFNPRGDPAGLGQSPFAAPANCSLSYRLFADSGVGAVVSDLSKVGHEYIAGPTSILVASNGQPLARRPANGTIVSNLVATSQAMGYVSNTASGPVLTVDSTANGGPVSSLPLAPAGPLQDSAILLHGGYEGSPSDSLLVGYGPALYAVSLYDGRPTLSQSATADSTIVAIASDPSLEVIIFATQQSLVAVNNQSLLTVWLTPLPGISSIALVQGGIFVATNSSLALYDYQLGEAIWTKQTGCTSPVAVTSSCVAACATSAGIIAVELTNGLTVWTWQQKGSVTDMIVNGQNKTLTVAASTGGRTVQVTVLDARVGVPLWSAIVPGSNGRLSVDDGGNLLLLTTFSSPPGPSYLYSFDRDGSGVPCSAAFQG